MERDAPAAPGSIRRRFILGYGAGLVLVAGALTGLLLAAASARDRPLAGIGGIEKNASRTEVDSRMSEAGASPHAWTRDTTSYTFPFPTRGLTLSAEYRDDRLQRYIPRDGSDSASGPPILAEPTAPMLAGTFAFAALLVFPLVIACALRFLAQGPTTARNEALSLKVSACAFEIAGIGLVLVVLRKAGVL